MRRISVIINTDGRVKSLPDTVDALRRMDHPEFEICVVCGPTLDGTREIARSYADRGWIKVAFCPERNLSQSRNIGIAMAAGEIVAFIDDDAIPEPEWLTELAAAYDDPCVKGAGGKVRDHTGYTYQYHYAMCDRLGNAVLSLTEPADRYNFPFSNYFPYIQGANSSFDRRALVEIGGFDEEYEFYLDETDLCCRMIDQGHTIRQLEGAVVHHKYLPSSIRNKDRITTVKYPIIKNKIYFSIVNNHGHFSMQEAIEDGGRFANAQREDLEFHVRAGRLSPTIIEDFAEDADRAWRTGLTRALSGQRRTRPAEYFASPDPFLRCPRIHSSGQRRTFVFLSQNFPPRSMGGNARHTLDIARAIADKGHTVHVLTRGDDYNRVDLESGVWVHRIIPKDQLIETIPSGHRVPQHIWNYSRTLLEEVERISTFRKIDAIEAPSWDCENVAMIIDGRIPVATNVVTALAHWLDTHKELSADEKWMFEFGAPMQAVEKFTFERSDTIIAASRAIVESIEGRYGVPLALDPRVCACVHGLQDMLPMPRQAPAALADARLDDGRVRILFLGRLELRKGIDLLLMQAAPALLRSDPCVEFWIAGDDSLILDGGLTARQRFVEGFEGDADVLSRVRFFGNVSDEEMRWLYANCDIFTSPSRFESFGLIFVEAMMFGKPAVGTCTSGIAEVIEHDVTGLLARVNDAESLETELRRLTDDPEMRRRLGQRGRLEFESRFDARLVAERRIGLLAGVSRVAMEPSAIIFPQGGRVVDRGYLLMPRQSIEINVEQSQDVYLTFYGHAWSGIGELHLDGEPILEIDLYHPTGRYQTTHIITKGRRRLVITRGGRKSKAAQDSEIIFQGAQQCPAT